MIRIHVEGVPVPQGSMRCLGRGGRAAHQLVATNDQELDRWRRAIADVVRRDLPGERVAADQAVRVALEFTVPRPKTVDARRRPWPVARSGGDIDKLQRAVFDAITASGLWHDDSQVVQSKAVKRYPDTPGLDPSRPGVTIRIDTVNPDRQPALLSVEAARADAAPLPVRPPRPRPDRARQARAALTQGRT